MRNLLARVRRAEVRAASLPRAQRVNAALYAFVLVGLGLIVMELRQDEGATGQVRSVPAPPTTTTRPPAAVEPGPRRAQEPPLMEAPSTAAASAGGSGSVATEGSAGSGTLGVAGSDAVVADPAALVAAPVEVVFAPGPSGGASGGEPIGGAPAFEEPAGEAPPAEDPFSLIPPAPVFPERPPDSDRRGPAPGAGGRDGVTPADPVRADPRPPSQPAITDPVMAEPAAPLVAEPAG